MALIHSPSIARDGLVLALDAANPRSYPGSGNAWFDLSGNGYNGSLIGAEFIATEAGGVMQTNGSASSWIDIPNSPNLASSDYTVITAAKYTGLGSNLRGRILNGRSNNWLIGHWSNSVANYFAEGWVAGVGAGGTDNLWRIYAASGRGTYSFYINGGLNTQNANGTQGPNGLVIGRQGSSGTEFSNGRISFIFVYNRILSQAEIQQNYNAMKGRFGV